jgi:hypothetical protein
LVTLCFTIPFWTFFCIYKYNRIAKHLFYGYFVNLVLNIIVLVIFSILYYHDK